MCDRRALKYGNTYSRAKKYNYTGEIVSGRKYIPHSQPSLNVSVRMYIPHSRSKENVSVRRYITTICLVKSFVIALPLHTILTILSFALLNASHTVHRRNCVAKAVHHTQFLCGNVCARWPNANSFQEKVMCDCSLIQHGLFLETVCVA